MYSFNRRRVPAVYPAHEIPVNRAAMVPSFRTLDSLVEEANTDDIITHNNYERLKKRYKHHGGRLFL